MHNIESFFKSINFASKDEDFKELEIEKVVLNKKDEVFNVYLKSKKVLPILEVDELLKASKNKINGKYAGNIKLNYEAITTEDCLDYVKEIVHRLTEKKPSLIEGNQYPGHDLYQLPIHRKGNIGVIPTFEKALNRKK